MCPLINLNAKDRKIFQWTQTPKDQVCSLEELIFNLIDILWCLLKSGPNCCTDNIFFQKTKSKTECLALGRELGNEG